MNDTVIKQIELLDTTYEYLGRLIEGVESCVDFFQSSREDRGYSLIIEIIDGLTWTIDAIRLTASLHRQELNVDLLKERCIELMNGLENQDSIVLADVLQYEILELLIQWKETIKDALNEHGAGE